MLGLMLGLKIVKRLCVGDLCRETVRSWGNRKFYYSTPAALTPPLRWEGSAAPHPSKGRGTGKGDGVKITGIKLFIPNVGIKCSQRGNKMFPTWE